MTQNMISFGINLNDKSDFYWESENYPNVLIYGHMDDKVRRLRDSLSNQYDKLPKELKKIYYSTSDNREGYDPLHFN